MARTIFTAILFLAALTHVQCSGDGEALLLEVDEQSRSHDVTTEQKIQLLSSADDEPSEPPPQAAEQIERADQSDEHEQGGRLLASVAGKPHEPRSTMSSLEISSHITWRFAETTVRSVLDNDAAEPRQVNFEMRIPVAAVVTNFTVGIGRRTLVSQAWERGQILKMRSSTFFEDGSPDPNNVVSFVPTTTAAPEELRDTQLFSSGVNLPGYGSAHVTFAYAEFLERRRGVYRHTISLHPQRIMKKLSATVTISEPQGLTKLDVREPLAKDKITKISKSEGKSRGGGVTERVVHWAPTIAQQRDAETDAHDGIAGDLVVEYDVEHGQNIDGVVVGDGSYFIQLIAPGKALTTTLAKRVVFVVDISDSMAGRRIEQTRRALGTMMNRLDPKDSFQLILFNDDIQLWPKNGRMFSANANNLRSAADFLARESVPSGMTNIDAALTAAFDAIRATKIDLCGSIPMIVFQTDGLPTAGVTDPMQIWTNVRKSREAASRPGAPVPVYALGIGFEPNFQLLRQIAETTGGFVRQIVDADDVQKQLEDFFEEIRHPLMSDLQLTYPDYAVAQESLAGAHHTQLFNGSEAVVAGTLLATNGQDSWTTKIEGRTATERMLVVEANVSRAALHTITPTYSAGDQLNPFKSQSVVRRIFAHLKIRDLHRRQLTTPAGDQENASPEQKQEMSSSMRYALRLAIENNLLTPLTALSMTEVKAVKETGRGNVGINDDYGVWSRRTSRLNSANARSATYGELVVFSCALLAAVLLSGAGQHRLV